MKFFRKAYLAALAVTAFSCADDAESITAETDIVADVQTSNFTEFVVEDAVAEADLAILGDFADGRTARCAVVTHNREAKTVNINFGEGCEGPKGKVRSGEINVSYTGERLNGLNESTISFYGYTVDEVAVAGRIIRNRSFSNGAYVLVQTVEGGSFAFPDGTVATRTGSRTFSWQRGDEAGAGQHVITGTMSGQSRSGVNYRAEILEPLTRTADCAAEGNTHAVSGILQHTFNGKFVATLDYGNGSCDNLAEVTKPNGELVEIELGKRPRGN